MKSVYKNGWTIYNKNRKYTISAFYAVVISHDINEYIYMYMDTKFIYSDEIKI